MGGKEKRLEESKKNDTDKNPVIQRTKLRKEYDEGHKHQQQTRRRENKRGSKRKESAGRGGKHWNDRIFVSVVRLVKAWRAPIPVQRKESQVSIKGTKAEEKTVRGKIVGWGTTVVGPVKKGGQGKRGLCTRRRRRRPGRERGGRQGGK